MIKIILCEGKTDAILISYFLTLGIVAVAVGQSPEASFYYSTFGAEDFVAKRSRGKPDPVGLSNGGTP